MIRAHDFLDAAGERGFRLYAGVPCSYLTPFIDAVIGADDLRYVGAANEGDAVAIGAGAELGGTRSVVMFQNSGLGNAVNPLTSLTHTFRLPVLLIPTLRGEPGGPPDEPQHELMGRVTTDLLDLMEVPWEPFPNEAAGVSAALDRALAHMEEERRPYALVMRKGTVAKGAGSPPPAPPAPPAGRPSKGPFDPGATRGDMLRAVVDAVSEDDVILATTGHTGRELYALQDRPNQLYMVGSMGCVASLALGLALARPDRRVVALDGDGALLMRLGVLATVGHERPPNLLHVVLDNGRHESTGGQPTVAGTVDLPAVAGACGYPRSERAVAPAELGALARETRGQLAFVHAPILPGSPRGLPRPELGPAEIAARLKRHLELPR